ncbi:MAG: sulfatase-like hydrolase/transferase, partial [Cyclobacteriaceae bacterium]|nr:sulfatase-like hydrolase/transferase [Cyclobacteriaceae bacterium]
MADDHTSQAWGVYGSILDTLIQMPGIQRLADEGCLLTNAFCTNSICVPSRATILTGQYSHVNKVYTLGDSLNRTLETFPKLFSAHGYTTAIIGKWHLKTKPAGFDYYNVL